MSKITRVQVGEKVDRLLSKDMMDREARKQLAHFMERIELAVFTANREVIHARIPQLTQSSFLKFATRVAELRAEYLAQSLALATSSGRPNAQAIAELRAVREAYEELLHAFDAMQRAIERGYADIAP